MSKYQDVPSAVWEDLINYEPPQKLLYLFLYTNPACRPSGLYKMSPKTLENYTGLNEATYRPLIGGLIEYDKETTEIWIKDKLKHIRNLFKNASLLKSVQSDINTLVSPSLKSAFVLLYGTFEKSCFGPPIGDQRQRQEHSQEQRQERNSFEEHEKLFLKPVPKPPLQPEPKRWDYPPEIQALVRSAIPKLSRNPLEEKKDEKVS